jgi:hypothetical protein
MPAVALSLRASHDSKVIQSYLDLFMDILAKLKELNLPVGEYVVVGSGLWAALGLRAANDLDLAAAPGLIATFRVLGYAEEHRHGKMFLVGDGVEVITALDWEAFPVTVEAAIAAAQVIDGFPFMSFEHALAFKKALGREKDRKDIAALEGYLARDGG